MNRTIKISISAITILLAVAAYIWFFVYNKPHRDFERARPDFVLSAEKCYNDFVAGKKIYTGKVVQISGKNAKFEINDSLTTLVFVFNEGMFGDEGIRCTLLPRYGKKVHEIDFSKPVTLKGFCSGFNDTDVILESCSIVETKN